MKYITISSILRLKWSASCSLRWLNVTFYNSQKSRGSRTRELIFVLILLGSNVTAAFDAQRHAEPRGPLASIPLDTVCTFLSATFPSQTLIGLPPVFTGELWVLHRLAGPLGLASLRCVVCQSGEVPQRDPGCGSKRQPVSYTCLARLLQFPFHMPQQVVSLHLLPIKFRIHFTSMSLSPLTRAFWLSRALFLSLDPV